MKKTDNHQYIRKVTEIQGLNLPCAGLKLGFHLLGLLIFPGRGGGGGGGSYLAEV